MGQKTCRVTITDMQGIDHTAQVGADTLYEAVARGLVALRKASFADELTRGSVRVVVLETPVEHVVEMHKFDKWVAQEGGVPRDITARLKVREILKRNR